MFPGYKYGFQDLGWHTMRPVMKNCF